MFYKNIIWEILKKRKKRKKEKKSKKIEKRIKLKWVIFLIGKERFPTSTCHSYKWWHAAKVTSDLLVGLKTQVYDDVALLLPFQWTDDDGSVQELRESKAREMLQQLEKIKSFWRKKSSVWFLTSGASTPAPVESGSGRCLYIQLRIIVQLRSHIFCFCCIITVALFFNFKNCSIFLNLCMLHCCFYLKNLMLCLIRGWSRCHLSDKCSQTLQSLFLNLIVSISIPCRFAFSVMLIFCFPPYCQITVLEKCMRPRFIKTQIF